MGLDQTDLLAAAELAAEVRQAVAGHRMVTELVLQAELGCCRLAQLVEEVLARIVVRQDAVRH